MRRLIWTLAALAAFSPLGAQSFREKVSVELVRVELLATDSGGRPLHDLGESEIRVLVDGRAVPVEGFEPPAPGLPAIPRALPTLPKSMRPLPTLSSGAEASGSATAPAEAPRYYMAILADETSSEQSNRKALYGEIMQFLQSGLPTDVLVQLMRFDGRLRVECPWTSDPERLRRGVAAMLQRRAVARLGPPGNLINNPEGSPNRPDFDAMEATGHARGSLAALFDALRQFPEKPGRKALYFISDGGPFLAPQEISRDLIATSGSDATTQGGPDALRRARLETDRDDALLLDSLAWDRNRSASLLTDIARQAVLQDIEIHPVRSAPHDLGGLVSADRSFRARATVGGGRSLDPRSSRAATAPPTTDIAAGQGMEAVAETTGGDAVLSRRFFEDGLRREADNRDAVYALSFRDPHPGDHRFHSIEIISTRPGVHLRYRRGYRILDTREALIQASINRLYVADDENPLGVRLGFQALGVQEGRAAARITVAFPAPPEAGGGIGQAGAMEVLGICAVRDGVLSAPIDLSGKGEPSLVGEATWLTRSGTIRVKPGSYRWSFAIRDETTGITSYLTFDRALP